MAGRKKLPEGDRKIPFCISIQQKMADRINIVKHDKSPMLSGILELIPDEWLTDYDKNPEQFLLKLKNSALNLISRNR